MSPTAFPAAGLLLLAILSFPADARAETLNCTQIPSLPTTISTPGVYCLRGDLASAASGPLVSILASGVTIDCNGYKIGGLAAGTAAANSAIEGFGVDDVVVRNCAIRGFRSGILLAGAGNLIEGNRIEAVRATGIRIQGYYSTIRDNRIFDTGIQDGTFTPKAIAAIGPNYILDNTIDTVVSATGTNYSAYGINLDEGPGSAVVGNRIRGIVADGSGSSYGILVAFNEGMSIRDNTVVSLEGSHGIECGENGVASGNHVTGFLSRLEECIDGGGNLTP